jgi:hypothetical protein
MISSTGWPPRTSLIAATGPPHPPRRRPGRPIGAAGAAPDGAAAARPPSPAPPPRPWAPLCRIWYPRCGSSWSSGVAGTSTWKWQGPAPCAREAAPEAGHHQGSDWPPRGTDARSSPPAAAVSRSIDPRIRTWNVPPDQLGRYKAAGARRGELLAAPALDGLGQHPGPWWRLPVEPRQGALPILAQEPRSLGIAHRYAL